MEYCTLNELPVFTRIDSHFVIKITDFGLSEDIFVRNYFRQGSTGEVVKLPVKWMAPESLTDGHFSEKSDVVGQGMENFVNGFSLIWQSVYVFIRVHNS